MPHWVVEIGINKSEKVPCMLIDGIDIYHIALPLKEKRTFTWRDRPWSRVETILVRMRSGGVSGWGEASPGSAPLGGEEFCGGVFRCLTEHLAPAILADPKITHQTYLADVLGEFVERRRLVPDPLDALCDVVQAEANARHWRGCDHEPPAGGLVPDRAGVDALARPQTIVRQPREGRAEHAQGVADRRRVELK